MKVGGRMPSKLKWRPWKYEPTPRLHWKRLAVKGKCRGRARSSRSVRSPSQQRMVPSW